MVFSKSHSHRGRKAFYGDSQKTLYHVKSHKLQLILGNTDPIHEREVNSFYGMIPIFLSVNSCNFIFPKDIKRYKMDTEAKQQV